MEWVGGVGVGLMVRANHPLSLSQADPDKTYSPVILTLSQSTAEVPYPGRGWVGERVDRCHQP